MGLFSWLFGDDKGLPPLGRIEVEVTASPNGPNGVTWSHRVKTSGHGHGNKIKAPRGQGYKITFDLDDDTELNVRFDASKPFYCKEGVDDPCPSSITTDQIMVDSCEYDELVVFDWNFNENEEELRYQLNFVTAAGGPIDSYDPIIINGGGGVKPNNG